MIAECDCAHLGIDDDMIWRTVTDDAPALHRGLRSLLGSM